MRAGLIAGTAAALLAPTVPAPAQAAPGDPAGTQRVSFRGVSVAVPQDWPVHRVDGRPGCVRFDREAVYVGDPSRTTCPPHIVGRTTAVHLTTDSLQGVIRPDRVVSADGSAVSVVVSAGSSPSTAGEIARSVEYRDAETEILTPQGGRDARGLATASVTAPRRTQSSPRRFNQTTYTGPGFDACTARSLSELQTWYNASPYKAVNMYIGGASRGCSQPNLTASWVTSVIDQGWVLIPTYVGLQAPCREYPNRIDPAQAAAQGRAGADDAIVQLNALGLGGGNPIYFDMEAFSYSNLTCRQAVLDFLDAWTARLHERGYVSGVYGSAASTIRALVSQLGNAGFDQPDDLWIARWCPTPYDEATCDESTNDPEVPADQWADHQRIRQYRGGHVETWGGVSINIDSNTVDAAVSPGQLAAEGSFVSVDGASGMYRVAGGAPVFTSSWESVGLPPQPVQALSPTQFASFPARPRNGTFLVGGATGLVYRVDRGVATHVPSWAPYGGPQPFVVVDQAALDNAGTGGVWNRLTSGRPDARMTGPAGFGTVDRKTRFTYQGLVSSSAVANYDVRWRRSRWDRSFEKWKRPTGWQRTAVTDVPLGLKRGWTYCVSVRARNRAGMRSDWSSRSCLARALDDRGLASSSGWREKRRDGFYAGTVSKAKRRNATLSRSGVRVKRIGVVATVCRKCGKVNVLVDGRKVGRINLRADTRRRQQVLMLPPIRRERGTITLKVRSSGLRVEIDGLVVSRA